MLTQPFVDACWAMSLGIHANTSLSQWEQCDAISNTSNIYRNKAIDICSSNDRDILCSSKNADIHSSQKCRSMPSDADWPSPDLWDALNRTVDGRLIRGKPLGSVCHGSTRDIEACAALQDTYNFPELYVTDPVNVMSPYWLNNSCSPYPPHTSDSSGPCTLGNLAQYAIRVSSAADVIAGVNFARNHNIRLTIKNTGHDVQGRSTGAGSLGLWMHNLKDISFTSYTCPHYTGPSVRIGAGIEVGEAYAAAYQQGLVLTGGICPSVGVAGGWFPGGGHGPLSSKYGLGADATLEFEVVTADGQLVTATQNNEHSELYWALSGGGPGNFGVVLSITAKAWKDVQTAGAVFTFANTNETAYWSAIRGWMKTLLALNQIEGLSTASGFTAQGFTMNFATLPGADKETLEEALAPYMTQLRALDMLMLANTTTVHPSFFEHYSTFAESPSINITMGARMIPTHTVANDASLDLLIARIREWVMYEKGVFALISNNVSLSRVGISAETNSVLPAWRDTLFLANFGRYVPDGASWADLSAEQDHVNNWQESLRDLTPGSGAYINEATFNDAKWKEDYFGTNYERLLDIKRKYDPQGLFWANTAVGSDTNWVAQADGRLCRP